MSSNDKIDVIFNADKPGEEVIAVFHDNVPKSERWKYAVNGREPSFIYDKRFDK